MHIRATAVQCPDLCGSPVAVGKCRLPGATPGHHQRQDGARGQDEQTDGADGAGVQSAVRPRTQTQGGPVRTKEGNVLFKDALNTFYLRLYGVGHMVEDQSDSERGNLLPPHGPPLSINSKGSFICTIP